METSNLDRAKQGSQKDPLNLPGDSSGAQSSPSIASLSKKELKKQRKKDRRQAKWLAANQPTAQGSEPGDPNVEHDSATSTEPNYPENTNPSDSDVLDTPEHLIDPAISRLDISTVSTESEYPPTDPAITHPDPPAISTEQEHHTDEPLALPTQHQDTSENLSTPRPDVAAASTGPGSLFRNPNLDEAATSDSAFEDAASAFEETASANSDDQDSSAEYHTPPENSSSVDHQEGPADVSEIGSCSNSDDNIASTEALIQSESAMVKSESDSVTPQTSSAPENSNSSPVDRREVPAGVSEIGSSSTSDGKITSTDVLIQSESDLVTPQTSSAHSNTNVDHREGPAGVSEIGSSSTSDGKITSPDVLIHSESDPVTPQTSSAPENSNSSTNVDRREVPAGVSEIGSSSTSDDHITALIQSESDLLTPQTHSAPEKSSSNPVDRREGPSGVSKTDSSSTSDDNITTQALIQSESDLVKSESDLVTTQTFSAPENSNSSTNVDRPEGLSGVPEIGSLTPQISSALTNPSSSNIATPNITSSASETPTSAKTQIKDDSSLRKEPISALTKKPMDESTQRSTAKSTKRSVRFLLEDPPKSPVNRPTRISAGRSRDEEVGEPQYNISGESSQEISVVWTGVPHQVETSGVMGLKWAYATHTRVDKMLLARGVWLFQNPVAAHFRAQPYVWKREGLGVTQAPAVIRARDCTITTPTAKFDGQTVHIDAHAVPWPDVRSVYTHPDAQPTGKLAEYQAAEAMGLHVWRHDRNLLDCRLRGCPAKLADHGATGVVCLGCGPKTIVRYCTVAHMVADLREHWPECGSADLVLKRVVDHTTTPARFGHLCPAIRDRHNTKSYALFRQGLFRVLTRGRYTLFDGVTEEPTALIWTRQDVRSGEMERRVERLLNFALFDQRNQVVVRFLFRMVRQGLQLKDSWGMGTIHALQKQFGDEFGLDASMVVADPVCECEWVGEGLPEAYHQPACRRLFRDLGPDFLGSAFNDYLDRCEARSWILRAWQQQHAAVGHWRDRVAGEGFWGEEVEGKSPVLGPGWTGWGAAEDDSSL